MDSRLARTLADLVLPYADVVTPNIPEAEVLADMRIASIEDMEEAARRIHGYGPPYVLVKGGHRSDAAADLLYDGNRMLWFTAKRIDTKKYARNRVYLFIGNCCEPLHWVNLSKKRWNKQRRL